MKHKSLSLIVLVSLALGVLLLSSCIPPRGTVRAGKSDPLVIIEAGLARFEGGGWYVRYLIDRSTQSCWLIMGNSVAPMSCCALNRVSTARKYITWKPCGPASTSPAPRPANTPPPRR